MKICDNRKQIKYLLSVCRGAGVLLCAEEEKVKNSEATDTKKRLPIIFKGIKV